MRFLLDTDTCVFAMKQHARVLQHLHSHRHAELAVSVVTEAELRFGAAKAGDLRKMRVLDMWLLRVQIVDFASAEAMAYAHLRAQMERVGQVIGPLDLLIAAHTIALDLVLVTNNVREFRRVPKLKIENWTI